MISPVELTIKIKGEEKKRLSDTHLIYEEFQMHQHDPVIQRCILETLKGFVGEKDRVTVTAKFEVV